MSRWTHSLCAECYAELEPGRTPVRVTDADLEACCRCNDLTAAGIFYRADPATMRYCAHRPEE